MDHLQDGVGDETLWRRAESYDLGDDLARLAKVAGDSVTLADVQEFFLADPTDSVDVDDLSKAWIRVCH